MYKIFFTSILFFISNSGISQSNLIECYHDSYPHETISILALDKIESIRTNKIAYNKDGGSFKIEFVVNDPNITSISFFDNQNRLSRNGQTGWFTLNDDQFNGDETSNDLKFTIDSLTITNVGAWYMYNADMQFTFENQEILEFAAPMRISCVWVDTTEISIPEITYIGDSIQHTDYVVNIKTNFTPFNDNYYDLRSDDRVVINKYFSIFEDDRDFILLSKPFPRAGTASASHYSVSNDIENLGIQITDNTEAYGSNGKLKGVLQLYLYHGLAPTFNRLATHEILHQYCCYFDWPSAPEDYFNIHQENGGHWNPVTFETSGFGRGAGNWATPVINLDSLTNNYLVEYGDLDSRFNDLELYYMGLMSKEEVSVFPTSVLINPEFQGSLPGLIIEFSGDGISEINANDYWMNTLERVPLYPNTQKEFTLGGIAVYDRLLTPLEMAAHHYYLKNYESNVGSTFSWATDGRGEMSTKLVAKEISNTSDLIDKSNEIHVFPNPGNGIIEVSSDFEEYIIRDISGAKIMKGKEGKILVDNLNSGLYFIEIKFKDYNIKTFKWLKLE